jgi:hypothetical protein
MKSVRAVLVKFYKPVQLENAVLEVYFLVQQKGYWGNEIKRRKATIKPPKSMEFSSQINKVTWQQNQMIYRNGGKAMM